MPHFVIAVKHNHDQRPWVFRATIDSDVFTKQAQRAYMGQGGDAYIVNRDGQYQTTSRFGGSVMDQSGLEIKTVPTGVSVISRSDKE